MSRQVHAEDLMVLARQRALSEEEERRLAVALQSSRELECLYEAGIQFDAQAQLLSGDEARFSRLVERTLERLDEAGGQTIKRAVHADLPPAPRASRAALVARSVAVSLGFGMLLCVTLASAWDYVEKRIAERAAAQQAPLSPRSSARPSASYRRRPPAPTLAPTLTAPAAVDSAPVGAPATSSHSAPPSQGRRPAAPEALTSSELFERANQARRNGDVEDAISLYERLAIAYPNSVESQDAKILRGNLLLSQRSPRAALRQFEDYHAGALSLEALWGRAQALRKLESPEEPTVLLELIRGYPDSPYAEAARRRLRELSR
jgi:TolA-binding protein